MPSSISAGITRPGLPPSLYITRRLIPLAAGLLFGILSAQEPVPGLRIDLTDVLQLDASAGQAAQLFIPDHIQSNRDEELLLVIHFHGAAGPVENAVTTTRAPVVLFTLHLAGLSSAYQNVFQDSGCFWWMLDMVLSRLYDELVLLPATDRLIVTSFSAGYGGVRELLRDPDIYASIQALVLADGLHSDLEPEAMSTQMQDFLRFANDASRREKVMVLTHSSINPQTYASTTQTADYLLAGLGLQREPVSGSDAIGSQHSRCDSGYFHLAGYHGETGQDHMRHFHHLEIMLGRVLDDLDGLPPD
jgi:hypothetical protein